MTCKWRKDKLKLRQSHVPCCSCILWLDVAFNIFQTCHNGQLSYHNVVEHASHNYEACFLFQLCDGLMSPCTEWNIWRARYTQYIEDIYFFEVNTKYISSSVLKTSEFSWVRSTNENFDVTNSRDEMYLVFTEKSKFSFFYTFLEDLQLINLLTMLQAESQWSKGWQRSICVRTHDL